MTIQIPDELARGMEGLASAQRKSVEEVAIESLSLLFPSTPPSETRSAPLHADLASAPQAVLQRLKGLKYPSATAIDEMEAAIMAARLPVNETGAFDRRTPE